ncbi:glycoside hydrolase family 13 protein [Gryllotalpicola ginsengisoli]|uniref:glycoside hydrolase family 13 protein n=1 Tax=Gryllotalpicola ginsengisoli TaxID=444608 RepID=UPI0003B6E136|nr:glycoside hydrolase family 13 protein [Gryllotalpicola ginsengisoli]
MEQSSPATVASPHKEPSGSRTGWWRDAVIYQIYPRSFADADGNGIGDLEGVRQHLDHLERLGVDAIWLSPFYRSPQADAGYDVADYRDVDPLFGTLDDFDRMLREAHERALRVIVDLVPNHTSSAHEWFKLATLAAPGSPERDRYLFRDGRGEHGELPPNNWKSVFGGPAWTRIEDGTENPQWYLHLFDAGQPDLNWRNPEVVAEFHDVLRFWLKRGVDGFRVDVAHGLIKQADLPDLVGHEGPARADELGPMWDQDDVHEIYRGWNRVLHEFGDDKILVAEAWVANSERRSLYVRHDEMQQAFNFGYMQAGWDAAAMRAEIDESLASNALVDATTTWVLSNHDVVRHTSRFGLSDPTRWTHGIGPDEEQPDLELGLRRGRAATLFMLGLPGSAYIYEGEELGLPEHTTLPAEVRQDPTFFRTGGEQTGRDGCRVPLPWDSTKPAFGFSPTGASWLPQPAIFGELAPDRQDGVPGSTLELYRSALVARRELDLGGGSLTWRQSPEGVLDFDNGEVRVVLNTTEEPAAVGEASVIVESVPGAYADGTLAPNAAVWLR